jgi:hypothetical protein
MEDLRSHTEDRTESFADNFLRHLENRGYHRAEPFPVSAGDRTVSFVNATLTPYKDALGAGAELDSVCHLQPCVRAHGHAPWLYSFDMVGVLSDRADSARVVADTAAALLAAAPWIEPAELVARTDPDDSDLRGLLAAAGLRVLDAPGRPDLTRWQYGDGYPLRGRGCTLVAAVAGARDCGPGCGADCACGRRQEIGNIILIGGAGRDYVETAFGVESVRALVHGGDLYGLPELAAERGRLGALGYPDDRARQIANLRRVLERLHRDGARPAGKGPGHVMRNMVGSALDLVAAEAGTDWPERVAAAGLGPVVAGLLADEAARRAATAERSRRAAARLVRRRAGGTAVTWGELHATFGLSQEDASRVLEASRPPEPR